MTPAQINISKYYCVKFYIQIQDTLIRILCKNVDSQLLHILK